MERLFKWRYLQVAVDLLTGQVRAWGVAVGSGGDGGGVVGVACFRGSGGLIRVHHSV